MQVRSVSPNSGINFTTHLESTNENANLLKQEAPIDSFQKTSTKELSNKKLCKKQ